jgi:hypothetical protein
MDLRWKTCVFYSRPDGTPMRVRLQIIYKYSQDQDLARHSSIMNAKEDIKDTAAFFISEPSVVSKLEPNF